MNIQNVFNDFCKELTNRQEFLSEDNVRFYWFASMLKQDSTLNNFSLEEPYWNTTINKDRKELDLLYCDGHEYFCFEIKFHRHPSTNPNNSFAHTGAAGEIFNDLLRIPLWQPNSQQKLPIRRFFLYVTDNEMYNYLTNKSNRNNQPNKGYRDELKKFYTIPNSSSKIDFRGIGVPKTFKETALSALPSNLPITIPQIKCVGSAKLSMKNNCLQGNTDCYVKLYEL